MKVAIGVHSQNLDFPSGMLSYYQQLIKYLPLRDPSTEYVVFCGNEDVEYYRRKAPQMQVVGTGWANRYRIRRLFTENALLPLALKNEKVDVLYHTGSVAPLWVPSQIRMAVAIFAVQHLTPGQITPVQQLYRSLLFEPCLRRAEVRVVNSEYTKSIIEAKFPNVKSRIEVIPHGIDETLFHPAPVTKQEREILRRIGIDRPYILFVGKVYPYKKLQVLVEAFCRQVKAHNLPHQLVVLGAFADSYGSGENGRAQILRMVEEAGLANRLIMKDFIRITGLRTLYAAADVYVQTSAAETFGKTVVEAMACGCPVLAARAAATPEVLGDAGMYYETDDATMCGNLLVRLLGDAALRRQLSEAGLERARRYSFIAEVDQLAALFHRLYESASPSPSIHGPAGRWNA